MLPSLADTVNAVKLLSNQNPHPPEDGRTPPNLLACREGPVKWESATRIVFRHRFRDLLQRDPCGTRPSPQRDRKKRDAVRSGQGYITPGFTFKINQESFIVSLQGSSVMPMLCRIGARDAELAEEVAADESRGDDYV